MINLGTIMIFLIFVALLGINMPIAFALTSVALLLMLINDMQIVIITQRLFSGADSFAYLALPSFILTGLLMNNVGISDRLMRFAEAIVGHVRGGLALVNILFSMFFGGISGSSVADTAAVGSILIPAMEKKGYSSKYAAAVTATSSTIGIIIPPSIPMIVYGIIAGVSISTLFIAGIIPGILIGLGQMLVAHVIARKENMPIENQFSWNRFFQTFWRAAPGLLLPVIILGGIIFGVFTPVEAGAVAVFYAILLDFCLYRNLKFKKLYELLVEASILTSIVMIIISASTFFGWVLAFEQIPQQIAFRFMDITSNSLIMVIMMAIIMILAGTFLHGAPIELIIVPMFLPLLISMQVDLIYFGMIVVLCVGIGQQTPPVGSALFITSAISKVDILTISKTGFPFILVIVAVLLMVIFIPNVVMYLPRLLGY